MATAPAVTTIDEYISGFPAEVAARLEEVRQIVHAMVPDVGEAISYKMPTFTLDGRPLVHVAGWKNHIGLYPLPPMDDELAAAAAPYRSAARPRELAAFWWVLRTGSLHRRPDHVVMADQEGNEFWVV